MARKLSKQWHMQARRLHCRKNTGYRVCSKCKDSVIIELPKPLKAQQGPVIIANGDMPKYCFKVELDHERSGPRCDGGMAYLTMLYMILVSESGILSFTEFLSSQDKQWIQCTFEECLQVTALMGNVQRLLNGSQVKGPHVHLLAICLAMLFESVLVTAVSVKVVFRLMQCRLKVQPPMKPRFVPK